MIQFKFTINFLSNSFRSLIATIAIFLLKVDTHTLLVSPDFLNLIFYPILSSSSKLRQFISCLADAKLK